MSETSSEPTAPRRRGLSNRARTVIGVSMLIAAAGIGGFGVGRETAPEPTSASSPEDDYPSSCTEPRDAVDRLLAEQKTAEQFEDPGVKEVRAGTVSNLVLQNPDCFDAEMKAVAQTLKDRMASNAG